MQIECDGMEIPVFVLRYFYGQAGNHASLQGLLASTERHVKMTEIPVQVDELYLFHALLQENSKRLSDRFKRSVQKHPMSVSTLVPISGRVQVAFYESLDAYCHHCGSTGVDVMKCSQCRKAEYCSRECQSLNWKFHKKSCGARR